MWLSDHDLDLPGEDKIEVYSGRGILSESQGPVWLIGTSMFCLINPHVRRALTNILCRLWVSALLDFILFDGS